MDAFKKIPELCVPAGNLNVLRYAIAYGADAVYIGGQDYNLRNFGDNFSMEGLEEAINYAHSKKVRIYFTLNAIVNELEILQLKKYIRRVKDLEFDAVIISDPGVFQLVREIMPEMRIHISTQSSTSNSFSVNFWAGLGAKRVNLSRELSYEDIRQIVKNSRIETEIFVHGALCISYSGRCMLSKYFTGRDANKGKCSHTCRWKYYLFEEKRPNLFFPVDQDKRGTYIYNSRDLCLIEKVDRIVDLGVDSIKIEGRMKTENYVSLATSVYRQALELIRAGKFTPQKKRYLLGELDKTTHRSYTAGFMFLGGTENNSGKVKKSVKESPELTENDNVGYIKKYRFTGVVEGYSRENNGPIIRAKNQFKVGDILDIQQPGKNPVRVKLKKMTIYGTGERTDVANTNDLIILNDLKEIDRFSLLKVKTS